MSHQAAVPTADINPPAPPRRRAVGAARARTDPPDVSRRNHTPIEGRGEGPKVRVFDL